MIETINGKKYTCRQCGDYLSLDGIESEGEFIILSCKNHPEEGAWVRVKSSLGEETLFLNDKELYCETYEVNLEEEKKEYYRKENHMNKIDMVNTMFDWLEKAS